MTDKKLTPMMEQYLDIKKSLNDEILFFRLGDFYEMFFDDAITVSKELGLTLTKRSQSDGSAPMCGIPYHVCDSYISKLVKKGYKVAICDQIEDPKLAKGIVKRGITKIITPGTFVDNEFSNSNENNYLLSVFIKPNSIYLTYTDYSTGELYTTSKTFFDKKEMYNFFLDECYRINPSEILMNNTNDKDFKNIINNFKFIINYASDESFGELTIKEKQLCNIELLEELNSIKKEKILIDQSSVNVLLKYLIRTQKDSLIHLNKINYYNSDKFLIIDETSKRNLELIRGINTNNKNESLYEVVDRTKTSMGSRELRKWIEEPLVDVNSINKRLNLIESFLNDLILLDEIRSELREIYDIERLSVKISNLTINPREINSLYLSLLKIKSIKNKLNNSSNIFDNLITATNNLENMMNTIEKILIDEAPVIIDDKRIIKKAYSKELDQLFEASEKGSQWLLDLEEKEKNRTNIRTLRIKYNKILGYFIEVSKSFVDKVPEEYIRKQTLVGSERYFSMELKNMESKILGSKEEALELQSQIFRKLKETIRDNLILIQKASKEISYIDVITSLSNVAITNNYVRPKFNNNNIIHIENGRHPIVEYKFKEELFVPNDTKLDNDKNMIHLITGPNMAGKSTYMRQVAILVIMAHIGSYLPCDYADICMVDRVFTRIGASDNLAKGDSTFMVEMKEVANITKHATSKSLIILDEVGRGTSTFDGLSIAWALVEYISLYTRAKTLFATHYHELVNLSEKFDNVSNLTISVERTEETIVFLRKIINGFSNNSYGIDVAKLAGINEFIIKRANEILKYLSNNEEIKIKNNIVKNTNMDITKEIGDKNFFTIKKDEFLEKISNININELSPLEALNLLNEIIKEAEEVK